MSDDVVALSNRVADATVAMVGAELRSWRVADCPLLWTPDPAVWAETAPILFPVVGWTRGGSVRVGDRRYPLGLHGFARTMAFRVEACGQDWVRLIVRSGDRTRSLYPFDFVLGVEHRLNGPALEIILTIDNCGPDAMPYACGLHPGFAWPFAGGAAEDYAITFAEAEEPAAPVISPDGLFTPAYRPVPLEGRHLTLNHALFAREALCFLDARSRSLRFARADGPAIVIEAEGFPHWALWSRAGGRFLSIESWTGYGDAVDSDGNLATKPSMLWLAPGGRGRHSVHYGYDR